MDLTLGRRVSRLFRDRFGAEGRRFFASGRVNLLGAHVDYHGGVVLPIAIDRGVFVVARARDDRRARFASLNFDGTHEASLDAPPDSNGAGWAAYPLGVLVELERGGKQLPGFDLAFGGDLPAGAGMSSSAAILVATATAVCAIAGLGLAPIDVARLAHRAETGFVGVKCGIMDQFASALGKAGHALWLDCKDQTYEHVPLPSSRMAFVVLDSMTRRELKDGGYNRRVAESTGALAKLKAKLPGITCLRDVGVDELDANRAALDDLEWKRARHVVTEVARVRRARELLEGGHLLEFGQLMWLSHLSSRHLYEVSTPRLDALHEIALGHPACFGARLTGAGFGGCALAVVRAGETDSFCAHVAAGFAERFGQKPDVYPLGFGGAPREVGDA
jgi:galactokinase